MFNIGQRVAVVNSGKFPHEMVGRVGIVVNVNLHSIFGPIHVSFLEEIIPGVMIFAFSDYQLLPVEPNEITSFLVIGEADSQYDLAEFKFRSASTNKRVLKFNGKMLVDLFYNTITLWTPNYRRGNNG